VTNNSEVVLGVDGLSKRFKLYRNSRDRLKDWLLPSTSRRYQEFWALRDVSFELHRGECLGVVGHNGAGKSTLLKLLTGTMHPTSGTMQLTGRVLSLLELGSDFNTELTGRQNVVQSAHILGFPTSFVDRRMADIEDFAELGDYFDRPVKQYSSGMFVRLAFSMYANMDPEIFLVDEALTVGDLRFSGKALARIREMLRGGTTLVFVSHSIPAISQLCNRAIWLHGGRVQLDGLPEDVTRAYVQFMVGGSSDVPAMIGSGQPLTATRAPSSADSATGPNLFTDPQQGLYVGQGWYPLEAHGGDVFRWSQGESKLILDVNGSERRLFLDVEPGPLMVSPMSLRVRAAEHVLAVRQLAGRDRIEVELPARHAGPLELHLSAVTGAKTLPCDDRELAFRVFGWGWSDAAELQSIATVPQWEVEAGDPDLSLELTAMQRALRASPAVQGAPARILHVVTRNASGAESVRYATFDPITLEVTIQATADVPVAIVGFYVKDVFDRILFGDRADFRTDRFPSVRAGEAITVAFACSKLPLHTGLYQITVGLSGPGLESEIWHLVERAWSIQVLGTAPSSKVGVLDVGWNYIGELSHLHSAKVMPDGRDKI
jgi:ABC-type polysaccharide/polyol phosphate transport system ATPase subunit